MKHTVFGLASLLALTASSLAQYTVQSKPFYLVLLSDDADYNGTALTPCHEGAALEGLCVGAELNASSSFNTFQFNTTADGVVQNATLGTTGYLTYELQGGNFNESEPMGLFYNPASNTALPLFEPSQTSATLVAFDVNNELNIQSSLDDTVTPPTDENVTAYYRWYVCESNFEGYTYETLNWVMGKYPSENPSCSKVGVIRQFV